MQYLKVRPVFVINFDNFFLYVFLMEFKQMENLGPTEILTLGKKCYDFLLKKLVISF